MSTDYLHHLVQQKKNIRENDDNLDLQMFAPWLGTTTLAKIWVIECVGENKHRHLVAKGPVQSLAIWTLTENNVVCSL